MAVLMLVTVAIGFARTYYLAGLSRAPLASPILQFHGAVFSSWILLLLVQALLVSSKRVDVHRKLGIAGFLLACAMVVLGVLTVANQLSRYAHLRENHVLTASVVSFSGIFSFAVLAGFAYALRRNTAAHKRLVLIATIALTTLAFYRWPVPFLYHQLSAAYFATYMFLVLMIAYDLWSTHRVNPATLWGSLFTVLVEQIGLLIGPTAAWHAFAGWVQGWRV